ncbi:MAG TPA: sigma-70 family RNA polymerase sigma factor [Planctomycetota bacterium]
MVSRIKRSKQPNLTLVRLWTEYREGDRIEARNALIAYYRPFAETVVRRVKVRLPRSVEIGDLEGAGDLGLIQAIQNFDPERGVPFEAFCEFRVRGAIMDELRRLDWLPRPVRNRHNQRKEIFETLRGRLGHDPDDYELAEAMNLSFKEYAMLFENGKEAPVLAGNKPGSEDGDGEVGLDFVEDHRDEGPIAGAQRRELLQRIASTLDAEGREILFKRFFEGRTLKEIGDDLQISQSRVSKILGRLIERLKERFEEQSV